MIYIRFASFQATSRDRVKKIIADETISDAILRCASVKQITENHTKVFKVALNGNVIDPKEWATIKLKEEDNLLIVPNLQDGDDAGSFFRTIAPIVAMYALGPVAGPGALWAERLGVGLVNAGIAFAASQVANQLIPPPVQDIDRAGSFEDSQMFTISSQGNSVNKYGRVPKVYGEHRMFPYVAANPYTDLEVDPVTGGLSQYFYCIYDFGLGPNLISDLKIGNTPLSNFTEVTTRLVDPNRPDVSEGVWDDALSKDFTLYKGDISPESIGAEINGNLNDGSDQSEYEVTRNAANNVLNAKQEISLNFVNPRGLYAFSSNAVRVSRTIELEVQFSKVGEDVWRNFNDPDYVDTSSSLGGNFETYDEKLEWPELTPSGIGSGSGFIPGLPQLTPTYISGNIIEEIAPDGLISKYRTNVTYSYVRNGFLVLKYSPNLSVGMRLKLNGQLWNGPIIGVTRCDLDLTINPAGAYMIVSFPPDTYISIPVIDITYYYARSIPNTPGSIKLVSFTSSERGNDLYRYVALGKFKITAASPDPHYAALKFVPSEIGNYKVRVRRISTSSVFNNSPADNLTWVNINSRSDTNPINTDKRHTFLEIRIKATGQLNGSLQNLSGIVTSVLDVWDGSQWAKQPTRNPAWVYADLLTGEVNKRKIGKHRLDTISLLDWADYCDEIPTSSGTYEYNQSRFRCDFILDFETTLQQLIGQVTGAGQASMNIIDGKYGVLVDREVVNPVQIFTPRNSSGFSSSRGYNKKIHALKVKYVDPNSEWQPNELLVYNDGYNSLNAEEFDDIQTFACSQTEQAYRFGRYRLAQSRLRQETIQIKVDFEHMVCTRGDFVLYVQDSMKAGGTTCFTKSIAGDIVTTDVAIDTNPMLSYGYTFRNSLTGELYTAPLTVISSDTFQLDGSIYPEPDDLIVIGEIDNIALECIVKAISPSDDMSATLTLVERAKEIYTIESVDTLPNYDPRLSRTIDPDFSAPAEVTDLSIVETGYTVKNSGYEHFIKLDWNAPIGAAFDVFEIYLDSGKGYDLLGITQRSDYTHIVDNDLLGTQHNFKVLAVSATGKKLSLGEVGSVSTTPLKKTSLPSNVSPFNCDITGETLQLFWEKVPDLDIKEYFIRYQPSLNCNWFESTILQRVSANSTLIATQARTGTYLIKAIDFNGNESGDAAAIITTIPQLNGLNIIDEIDDFPTLNGVKDRVVKLGNTLILQQEVMGSLGNEQYYSEGYYYLERLYDAGEIYQSRIQAQISAQGYVATDLMSNWSSLSSVLSLYSPLSSDWDVEFQYRSTDTFNVIEDWASLSSIATLSGGSETIWTEWRKFNIGDVTGRICQFRIKLSSFKPNVTPRVLLGSVKIDMPDRTEAYNNVAATTSGAEIAYSPEFKNVPNVQITLENGQSGDYWEFDYKTKSGFKVVFYNTLGNPVARQFDAQVKGYGRKATSIL